MRRLFAGQGCRVCEAGAEVSDAERYAALRALYLRWWARTGDAVHRDLAAYCTARIGEVG